MSSASAAARSGVLRVLGAASLEPAGMPPSTILVVRRLALPERLALGSPVPSRAWEGAARAALEARWRGAARPARGPVPAGAEAVLFADAAEMIAAFARDVGVGGGSAWWWRALLRGLPADPAAALAALWAREARFVPAALEALAASGDAVRAVRAMPSAAVGRVFAGVAAAWEVPALWGALAGASRSSTISIIRASVPWAGWVPASSDADGLDVSRAALVGVGRMLIRAPLVVRSPAFAAAFGAWAGGARTATPGDGSADVAARGPVAPDRVEPRRQFGDASADVGDAGKSDGEALDAVRSVGTADGGVARSADSPAASAGAVPSAVSADAADLVDATDLAESVAPVDPVVGSDLPQSLYDEHGGSAVSAAESVPPSADAGESADAHGGPPGARAPTPRVVDDGSVPDGGPSEKILMARCAVEGGVPQERAVRARAEEVATASGACGVFFLVNVLRSMGFYRHLDAHWRLAPAVGGWGWVELVARALLGPRAAGLASDPVWAVLAELDGRDPGEAAGRGFVHSGVSVLPAEWAALFRDGPPAPAPSPLVGLDASPGLQRFLDRVVPPVRARIAAALAAAGGDAEEAPETALLRRTGIVRATRTHVDVSMDLDQVSLPVRLAGLDADPGWVPELARVVAFHFG